MKKLVEILESFVFGHRLGVLGVLLAFTVVMGFFAIQLRMEAGFEKQMPIGHEYVQTFQKYREQLFGANRLTIVVKARKGTIWDKAALARLYEVTQAVINMPNVDRMGVQSLWTPNSFVNEITEEGFSAKPIIPGTVTSDALTPEVIGNIERATSQGGYIGSLVSRDQTSAMITAELAEVDAQGVKIDYIAYNKNLNELRKKFEDKNFEIQIIGFAKQIGDIAEGAASVEVFCAFALLLTALAVYWYCRSVRMTVLPLACSFTSLVWQFGTLKILGYGLDPLAVLVPFLVFSIGVSHGVQQINFIVRCLARGKTTMDSARESFTGLLIPGVLALVTAFISFITLLLIPIPMIKELAVTASLGVGYKILTNLVMLPVAVSFCNFSTEYAHKAMLRREARARVIKMIAAVAKPRNAVIVTCLTMVLLGVSIWLSHGRIVGTLQPGAPELRPESRYNRDAVAITESYDMGLDWLTVVFEAAPNSTENIDIGRYQDDFIWEMQHVPGVLAVKSFAGQLRTYSQGYNEGTPKMAVIPNDPGNFAGLAAEIARNRGYVNSDCSMTAVHFFLKDHKATTINRLVSAIKDFRKREVRPDIAIRLASGNAGVLAAINDELEKSETPMLLYVYAAIVIMVLLVYRDFRSAIACCLPLTVGTFVGYWFMKEFQIGLTVATLPVMVLAVGIGVDYALYIYNRLQMHLADGDPIVTAMGYALEFEGMATIFTAITLSIGVATWSFSTLKFQADMGKLLAFMFIVNLVMAFTALPAFAVVLERVFKRKKPAYSPSILKH
ncbi:efflux RND transporter permease subunit [Geobacter grbiciae]|uniref:efflux RND transporter permease subunit n=1 Tax=Geobacter grbiciae TaxID=155042 RepID=UPI001C0351BA|nr:MMPL family transporter [Geobacter grbiciae]